jgi:hypothetical protein
MSNDYATSRILIVNESQTGTSGCLVNFQFQVEVQNDGNPGDYPKTANVSFLAYDGAGNYFSPDPITDIEVDFNSATPKHCDSGTQTVQVNCSTATTSGCTLIISPTDGGEDTSVPTTVPFNNPCFGKTGPQPAVMPCSAPVVEIHIRVTGGAVTTTASPCGEKSHHAAPRIEVDATSKAPVQQKQKHGR